MKRLLSLSVPLAMLVVSLLPALPASAVTGAISTTVDPARDGAGTCLNGSGTTNCNIYTAKNFVWISGLPVSAALGPGTYFFAVLSPGGQADPNDGAADNLSSSNDAWTARQFSVDGSGKITNLGTHTFDAANNLLNLAPYADTPNPGGVYIAAVCMVPATIATTNPPGVSAKDCKYDAFKVRPPTPPAQNSDLIVTKDVNNSFTRKFTWGINKSVDQTKVTIASGGTATFNYTVKVTHDNGADSLWQTFGTIDVFNPNDQTFTGVTVTDSISDWNATCSVTGGSSVSVATGDNFYPYTCTYSTQPAAKETNTATASWDKTANNTPEGSSAFSIDFTFSTTPTTLVDDTVSVTDTLEGTLGTVKSTDPSPTTFTYQVTRQGVAGTCTSYDNTATFTTKTSGTTGSSSQTVSVCVASDLTVSKTATPTFTRSYAWKIAKSVDKTLVKQIGGSATFNYTVVASETGFSDSSWLVSGTITVKNPNDFESIVANVTDAIDNGGSCSVTGGTSVTVAASGSVAVAYSCSYSSAPSPSAFTNTGTATWDSAAYFTPDATASGTATGDFSKTTPTTTVNKTVTVTDTLNGTTTSLGTLTATDASPFASATYNYSHTITVPTTGCVSYTNTATIKETGQSDSKTVTVCGPEKTGALTMGFWQNKNGQGVITGGASTSGVCNSGTWLRQYAPFQDLSSTASCASVASYVTNVIKSANASGAAMNAMLKAQMLATALDVYFSDPALGGNKIGAPAPIGGDSIDLTLICKMIDNTTSGAGTCGGSSENVSSAFGGATSMTVSQMLSYAASQSNAGGVTWYAQNKTTQGLAKDAFDATNNGVVFAP